MGSRVTSLGVFTISKHTISVADRNGSAVLFSDLPPKAGYRAGFTIPVWEWPEPARHGASAPCLGAAWGSLQ